MVFSFQCGIADVADKAPLHRMLYDVLLDQVSLWQGHLTFGTAVEYRAVKRRLFADLTGLKEKSQVWK